MRFFLAFAAILSGGCGAGGVLPSVSDNRSMTAPAVSRQLVVTLVPTAPAAFTPLISQRRVLAEPRIMVKQTGAEARYQIEGIEVVRLLDSCDKAEQIQAHPVSCSEFTRDKPVYEAAEVEGITDDQGRVVLSLPGTGFRVRVQAKQTAEDSQCQWSGSVTVDSRQTAIDLPMLVHCASG